MLLTLVTTLVLVLSTRSRPHYDPRLPHLPLRAPHLNDLHLTCCSSSGGGGQTVGNVSGSGAVTIYTTTTNEGVTGGGGGSGGGNITGGPLQEIIVNPTSMVGWRLSANGSLIPPHDLLTGSLPNAATQKRGSERLFQYLEAEGSDPEDYARYLPTQLSSVVVNVNLVLSFAFVHFFICIVLCIVASFHIFVKTLLHLLVFLQLHCCQSSPFNYLFELFYTNIY